MKNIDNEKTAVRQWHKGVFALQVQHRDGGAAIPVLHCTANTGQKHRDFRLDNPGIFGKLERKGGIEKSIKGYKEIEYEVMRDSNDTAITICNMENLDPVGIHTGDSIVVCPSQTLTNKEYHMLRDSALKIIRALKIEGGCNVQFALDPASFRYYLIEVNPRVSRSSALASKASGYPIARVSAKIGVGMTLDEIRIANTPASFEPALDYVVTKMPRFPFDKFTDANNALSTQMKATGV